MNNVNHVLHELIPPQRNTCHDLRSRHIVEPYFIIRMLFKDLGYIDTHFHSFIATVQLRSVKFKRICYNTQTRL